MSRDFPYLQAHEFFRFPPVEKATEEGIIGVGGNLSPGMLLSAYKQGVFPWFSDHEPVLWWSPDPRFVLFAEELHVPRSLRKTLRKDRFEVRYDTDFPRVVRACAETPRQGQSGTWITQAMFSAYLELHELGFAHSVEVLLEGRLVGGLYGVSLGRCFFGESMFSTVTDASKVGFVRFVEAVSKRGIDLIDSQIYTDHLARFGAREIRRRDFLAILKEKLKAPTVLGPWTELGSERVSS
jgi:leucyl/phenylalanyl-tRNA--protein transferase